MSRIVRWIFVPLAVLATSAGAQVRRPLPDDTARLRLEAINLLQGHDTMPFLDTARVRLVAGALRAIRRELPQLADIPAGPDRSFLVLMPADSVREVFIRRSDATRPAGADSAWWAAPVSRVGIPAIDSLYAGTRARRWWCRQHAVHVLGLLLDKANRPWYNDASRYSAFKQEALARRRESYGALIDRLGDSDPDVALLAHKYLRELSGQTFPGGEAGIAEWRKWLNESP